MITLFMVWSSDCWYAQDGHRATVAPRPRWSGGEVGAFTSPLPLSLQRQPSLATTFVVSSISLSHWYPRWLGLELRQRSCTPLAKLAMNITTQINHRRY